MTGLNKKRFLKLVLLEPQGPVELFKIRRLEVSARISGNSNSPTVVKFEHTREFELVSGDSRLEIPAGQFSKTFSWEIAQRPDHVQRLPDMDITRRGFAVRIEASSGTLFQSAMIPDATSR